MSNLLKDKDYNRDLRAQILICSIREEEAASEILKNLLRLCKCPLFQTVTFRD
jgi:hypothetical protein